MGVADSFRPVSAALTDAQQRIVEVVTHVDSVKAQMHRAGFLGILRGLNAVKAEAERLRTEIASLAGDVTEVERRATPITDETIPGDVIAGLTPVLHDSQRDTARVRAILTGLHRLSELVFRTLKGGSPDGLMARVNLARTAIQRAGRGLNAAITATEAALQRARDSGTRSGGSLPVGLPRDAESDAHTETPSPPPAERAGSRVVTEEPNLSGAESFRRAGARRAGDVSDAVGDFTSALRQGWHLKPTGQHVGRPPSGPGIGPAHVPAPWGDMMTGVAALGAMVGEVIRLSRKHWRGKK